MTSNRREFIERLGAAAVMGALPSSAGGHLGEFASPPQGGEWDLSWTGKLKGIKHKAIFDCTEIESGYGVWRASIWEAQYQSTLAAKPAEIKTVLILRHNGVAMALKQEWWDRLEIGNTAQVKHPLTEQPTNLNPALITAGVPPIAGDLTKFIARGGIVLACNLALQEYVAKISARDGVDQAEAQRRATAGLVPGITLQPSGVFAAVKAGEEGCVYVKAS